MYAPLPAGGICRLTITDFVATFPYHFVMDQDCKFVVVGNELSNHVAPDLLKKGASVLRAFEINRPQVCRVPSTCRKHPFTPPRS